MNSEPNVRLVEALKTFSQLDGKFVALAGGTVLIGWIFDNELLMRVFPGFVAMNPMTAVCFMAAGTSLCCFWSSNHSPSPLKLQAGQMLAGLLVIVSVLKLLDYLLGWNFRVDELLFRGRLGTNQGGIPNRMAPNTAINFLLSGFALSLLNSRAGNRRLSQNLSLVVSFHSLLALLGYTYSANYLYGIGSFIPMALHTAVLFLLLSLGMLFAQMNSDAVALFVSNTPGGVIARRLLPFSLGVPAILGAFRLWGEKHEIYNSEFGVTVMVVVLMAIFTGLIWWNAVLLNRTDLQRREAEAELKTAHDELEIRVQERTAALRAQMAEREKLEQQFLRSQRMESVGALAGGIAHDLNNALVPILMGSQLLRNNGDMPGQREKLLDLIMTSGNRCTEMVKQILTFAKGRSATGPVQLGQLIAEMKKIASDTFPKSIVIESEVENDLWTLEGDATELHQVLMNLCVNARDAMPEGGRLAVNAANIVILPETVLPHPEATPGRFIVLSVADTGTGIPPDLFSRIFEPFFTTKSPERGTGLGLSTVAQIVKRHKGFVQVQSGVGKGTQFKIYLPAADSAGTGLLPIRKTTLPSGQGELVLVVDDEQLVLELAKTTLENFGYRVLTAPNGLEAIPCFEAHKNEIRLVVTDTDMPFMDGKNAIKEILKINSQVPIIVASGTVSEGDSIGRLDSTHVTVLQKPYGVEQLLECVSKQLRPSLTLPSPMPSATVPGNEQAVLSDYSD